MATAQACALVMYSSSLQLRQHSASSFKWVTSSGGGSCVTLAPLCCCRYSTFMEPSAFRRALRQPMPAAERDYLAAQFVGEQRQHCCTCGRASFCQLSGTCASVGNCRAAALYCEAAEGKAHRAMVVTGVAVTQSVDTTATIMLQTSVMDCCRCWRAAGWCVAAGRAAGGGTPGGVACRGSRHTQGGQSAGDRWVHTVL
jgi:hypothetical protein